MSKKNLIWLAGTFYFYFLLLTPLGLFNDWIPPLLQTGYYSVTVIDPGDDTGYYAYLRSFFFDGDLDFINEVNYAHAERFTPTGYVFNNWQIGQSILFLPFFLVGHLIALILNGMGYPVSVDGYSAPYHISTAIASQTYVFIGLLFLFQILRKYYSEKVALIATLATWLASPLLYFTFIRQRMAHGTEFCFSVVFLYVWLHYRTSGDKYKHAVMGAVLGLLCMVRLINISFFFLYLADQAWQWKTNVSPSVPGQWKKRGLQIASFGLLFILVFSPQIYTWNQLNGPAFGYIFKALSVMGDQAQSSSSLGSFLEKIQSVFYGPQWSLVFATPILFAGFIGVIFVRSPLKEIWPGLIAFLLVFFVVLSTTVESASYGNRYVIPGMGVFALGFAGILERTFRGRRLFSMSLIFIILCVFAQYSMIAQYKVTLAYNDPDFTLKALSAIPLLIYQHPFSITEFQPHHLLRSTNFVKLMFLEHSADWNYRDFIFLFVFPAMQLASITLVLGGIAFVGRLQKSDFILFRPAVMAGGFVLTALSLVVLVGWTAPDKTEQEILNREIFAILVKRGDSLASAGKLDEALALFDKASSLMPDHWAPYFRKGSAYDVKKNYGEANKNYRKVLATYPNHAVALLNIGDNLNFLGKLKEAEFYLKLAVQANPYDANAYNALGQVFGKQDKFKQSENLFKVSLTFNRNDGKVHYNLAVLLTLMNQREKAKHHLIKAIQLGEKNPGIPKLAAEYNLVVPRNGR